jgi:chromosomal replication initiation ATPase DnaA
MTLLGLDPRFTFDTFIVGAANRLAAAAAKRVATSPGTAYNPLFLYSASGLGKTHLGMAIGHHARRLHPETVVIYDTLEHLLGEIMAAIEAGERDAFRHRVRDAGLLILDDVQFLAGRRSAQDELLRAWDTLSLRGGQLVLASDRPPSEINDLDERLLSRFSGGLIADITAPDLETRIAILNRNAEVLGQSLPADVAAAVARITFANVRELQGALNRLLAVQELEGRPVAVDDVVALFGVQRSAANSTDEFGAYLGDITGALEEALADDGVAAQLAAAIHRWSADDYRTARLEAALRARPTHREAEAILAGFEEDVRALAAAAGEIARLEPDAPELARRDVLRHPDRRGDAEHLLGLVRERNRSLPALPAGPRFEALTFDPGLFAARAARAIADSPGGAYNPLFVHGEPGSGRTPLLTAIAHRLAETGGGQPVIFQTGTEFGNELIRAIEQNLVDGWRARLRRVRALIIDDVDALVGTERAQEELFHLFDDMRRDGVQLVFSARVPPRDLGVEERLRTRLESGLVVDFVTVRVQADPPQPDAGIAEAAGAGADPRHGAPAIDDWFTSREKAIWHWPDPAAWLADELD